MSEPSERVFAEVTIVAPVETVWRALRDPAWIRRWFGWEYDGLEAEIEQIFVAEAEADEAAHTLRWSHGDVFALTPSGGGTLVRVTRAAPAGETRWGDVYDDIGEGWLTFVHQLRLVLELHPDDPRRTVYLSGAADVAEPADVLELTGTPASGRYAATLPTGEDAEGEVWFRAPHQLALTVDGYGDGLLVVTRRPASADGGGRASATVIAYGLDDAAFAALRERWTAWWRDRYGVADQPAYEAT